MVNYLGLPCAAKEIHSLLLDGVSAEEKKIIKHGFLQVQFDTSSEHNSVCGHLQYFMERSTDLPIMVMELMMTCVASFVQNGQSEGKISIKTKLSILHDVSLGLSYLHNLHGRRPSKIHHDLSSNNVLYTN